MKVMDIFYIIPVFCVCVICVTMRCSLDTSNKSHTSNNDEYSNTVKYKKTKGMEYCSSCHQLRDNLLKTEPILNVRDKKGILWMKSYICPNITQDTCCCIKSEHSQYFDLDSLPIQDVISIMNYIENEPTYIP